MSSDTIKACDALPHQSAAIPRHALCRASAASSCAVTVYCQPNQTSCLHPLRLFPQGQNIFYLLLETSRPTITSSTCQTASLPSLRHRAHKAFSQRTRIERKPQQTWRIFTSLLRCYARWTNFRGTNQGKQKNQPQRVNVSLSLYIKPPANVRYMNLGRGFVPSIRLWHEMSRV